MKRFTINENNNMVEDNKGVLKGFILSTRGFSDKKDVSPWTVFLDLVKELEENEDDFIYLGKNTPSSNF